MYLIINCGKKGKLYEYTFKIVFNVLSTGQILHFLYILK